MATNRGLGRGLDAIFLDNSIKQNDTGNASERLSVSVSLVDTNPGQPRKSFDAESLSNLADSIEANGLLQPILVRKVGERYEIIAGERRFRACKMANLTEIPVIVIKADDVSSAKYALIENIQREDLNPYEEAAAFRTLMKEYGLGQEEVSAQVGKSRSAIANSLRLLELPPDIVKMLTSGSLTAGHCRALLGLRDSNSMVSLAQRCIDRNLSVRDAEAAVKVANRRLALEEAEEKEQADGGKPVVDYIKSLETRFTRVTGRQCKITATRNKKSFQIEFRDNDDLEGILKLLAGDDVLVDF